VPALLFLAGCGGRTSTIIPPELRPLPTLSEPRDELIARVGRVQADIDVLAGTSVRYSAVGLGRTSGVQDDYGETQGELLVSRPGGQIRMRGTRVLGTLTVFDMASDGEMFEVSLPIREQFITGQNDSVTCSENAILNLRPNHVMEALLVDLSPYTGSGDIVDFVEEVAEGIRSFYVLSFIDVASDPATLLEKIWVDRTDLNVARKQLFGEGGVLRTDVRYFEWEETESGLLPRLIAMERPEEEYSLTIRFEEVRTDLTPGEDAFDLPPPTPGTQMITVNTRAGECP
jgi:hypothetical protein